MIKIPGTGGGDCRSEGGALIYLLYLYLINGEISGKVIGLLKWPKALLALKRPRVHASPNESPQSTTTRTRAMIWRLSVPCVRKFFLWTLKHVLDFKSSNVLLWYALRERYIKYAYASPNESPQSTRTRTRTRTRAMIWRLSVPCVRTFFLWTLKRVLDFKSSNVLLWYALQESGV